MNRINEITFNSSLLAEFRAIDFVTRLIDQGKPAARHRRRANTAASTCTASRSTSTFKELTASSKLNSDFDFFEMLKKGGREAARSFLDAHFDDIGVRTTVDLGAEAKAEWA